MPKSSLDTDDEYDAMEDVRTRADSMLARRLQEDFDAKAAGIGVDTARPPFGPGITISGRARPSDAPHRPTTTSTGAPPVRSKR